MGDRLVCVIRHEGEPIAASYQHWSAPDHGIMGLIIDSKCESAKDYDNITEAAVNILYNSLIEFNNSEDSMVGFLVDITDINGNRITTDEDIKFAATHPNINSDPSKIGRTDGMVTINKSKIEEWEGWAEYEIGFNI